MCCRCCSVTQQKLWVFVGGALLIALGLVCILWWPPWITDQIYKALPLSACSRTYEPWVTRPIPSYNHMFLFNWTNPEQVRTAGIKPHFEQLGPYVFREEYLKDDITWYANKTVSFNGQRTWFFEPDMSNGTLADLVTCPHLPSIVAANAVRDENIVKKTVFNNILNRNGGALYQTHTAIEWLFEGFFDEFLDFAKKLNNSAVESSYFAWLLNRNGSKTFEGTFTIHTGQGDLREMGELKFWKGLNHTGFYENDCGRLNGSTSDLWVPRRESDEYITVFITDTCRIINLVPTEWVQVQGIEALKYETMPDTFDNGQRNPDMQCYCPVNRQPDNCPATGATDLGPCAEGVPLYMSHPHFMYADPSYANTITGMRPNYDEHSFFIVLEPKLGIPLQVNANVMVSLLIRSDKDITILRNIPDFYAPVFTTASRAAIKKELAGEVKLVLKISNIGRGLGIALVSLGGVLLILGVVLSITRRWYGQKKLSELEVEAETDKQM